MSARRSCLTITRACSRDTPSTPATLRASASSGVMPTVLTLWPFSSSNCRTVVVILEHPFEDVATIALARVLVLSLTVLISKVSPFEIWTDAASPENAFRSGLVTWENDPHPPNAAVDSIAIGPLQSARPSATTSFKLTTNVPSPCGGAKICWTLTCTSSPATNNTIRSPTLGNALQFRVSEKLGVVSPMRVNTIWQFLTLLTTRSILTVLLGLGGDRRSSK